MSKFTSEMEEDIQRTAMQLAEFNRQEVPLSRTMSMLTVATSNMNIDDQHEMHFMQHAPPIIEGANPQHPPPVELQDWAMVAVPESEVEDQNAFLPVVPVSPPNVQDHVGNEMDYELEVLERQKPWNPRTPYQGPKRCIGVFYCQGCKHEWMNRNSRANTSQPCRRCNAAVYPHKQLPIPVMRDEEQMPSFAQFNGFD